MNVNNVECNITVSSPGFSPGDKEAYVTDSSILMQ